MLLKLLVLINFIIKNIFFQGMKVACTHFQAAAGILQYLKVEFFNVFVFCYKLGQSRFLFDTSSPMIKISIHPTDFHTFYAMLVGRIWWYIQQGRFPSWQFSWLHIHCISSNNKRPLIYRLPQIITPPLLFLSPPPCQVRNLLLK